MEIIKTYLDNMFMNLPQTDEVEKAKKAMLEMMEDKYHELKAFGKTENEAIGIVISEFGNLEELARELGIESYMNGTGNEETEKSRRLDLDEAKEFLEMNMSFGAKIALGVMLCICSPIAVILLGSISGYNNEMMSGIGAVIMFLMIACAVGLFIYNGIKHGDYEYLKKEPFILDYRTEMYIREEKSSFQPVFTVCITLGVMLCIISLVPIFISEMIFQDSALPAAASIGIMFILISIGVFLFIFVGVRNSGYQILLKEGDYKPKKKKDHITELLSTIYWSVMVCVYLIWSFTTRNWAITWIIWPVAGILYGVIEAIINAVQKD